MNTRRLLILAPVVLIIVLLQSYFWVPTYEQQTRGNPARLTEYITASIGDAAVLNPILSADSASSNIGGLVFEGLIDRDEELRFRGRLASDWKIYEEAFFYVNEQAGLQLPGGNSPQAVAGVIESARDDVRITDAALRSTLDSITAVEVLPSRQYSATRTLRISADDDQPREVRIDVSAPARIRLTLDRVDQNLFDNLALLLGENYFKSFPARRYLRASPDLPAEVLNRLSNQILPAVEHNPVIVFYLRPGIKFHDGHVLDAEDVRFTYESIMNPRNLSPRAADYEPVKAVEVLDPLTVRIVYKRLYSPAFGTWYMGILPQHLLNSAALKAEAERLGKDPQNFTMRHSSFNRNPIGCGPFVFREWKSDQFIRLDRFEGYWEGPPNYQQYVYRIIPDLLTQEMEFYAGTVDSYAVQPHQVQRLKRDDRFQNFSGTSFGYTYIGYNMRRKPFDDRRVRLALGMAIDVNKIIKFILHGQGARITGPFVKQTDFYNQAIQPLPYDPQGALRLLAEAGWRRNGQGWLEKDGKRLQFTLITNSGNDLRKAILAVAQDAWKQIGIDVRTDLVEWSVFIQKRVNQLDFDALVLGWSMGIDPDLYQIWHSSQTEPQRLNFVGFANDEADELIVRIRQEYDHDQQVAYCHRLHAIIADQQPYTFLYVSKWTAVLDKRIVILNTDSEGNRFYEKITPTKTGNYTFYFNKWIKLPIVPTFDARG